MRKKIRQSVSASLLLFSTLIGSLAFGQVAWVDPAEPNPGDLVTVYYDTDPGSLPNTPTIRLHWGINSWTEPPESMWPEGTVVADAGMSVQTPMIDGGEGVWSLSIQTDTTVEILDFVFTNGSSWDNNNGQDWHIPFGEQPPPPVPTWYTFEYDSRSAYALYSAEEINRLYVRGVFNSWGTGNPFPDPDERGVYAIDVQVPVGENPYKFYFVNSSGQEVWMQDPDNPIEDGGSTSNSMVIAEADTIPYFSHLRPFEGKSYTNSDTIFISGIVRTADDSVALADIPDFWTIPETDLEVVSLNPETGVFTTSIRNPDAVDGPLEIHFLVEDDSNRVSEVVRRVGIDNDGNGFHVYDGLGDANGTGSYEHPDGDNDVVDIDAFHISQVDEGDSIRIAVDLVADDAETRVLLQIGTDVNGRIVPSPFDVEFGTPEWNGSGLQILLANENSTSYDPEIHNRLITSRLPLEYGPTAFYNGPFDITLSVADLETYLGTYATGWYYGAFSFIDDGTGAPVEINSDLGGIDEDYDSDVFDLMFVDTPELQKTLIANYTASRLPGIDNKGRGFAFVEPDQIGPDVGSDGPLLRWVTRNVSTLNSEKTIYGFTGDTPILARIQHSWDGGEDAYVAAGVTGQFYRNVTLHPGENTFQMWAAFDADTSWSPVLRVNLKTPQAPEAVMEVSVNGNVVTLDASGSTDPQDQTMVFSWMPDPDNPEEVSLSTYDGSIATFTAPETLGEYYFDMTITDSDENITHARTMATVHADSVEPFDIGKSAKWIEDMIMYEIYPRSYSSDEQLSSITADMQRIEDMGYTAIWLMPIYPGPTTHGYEITDYYGIEEDLGTMDDFVELVETAHDHGLKVILDMVINHSSVEHPFMQDRLNLREASNYWEYYDSNADTPDENYTQAGNYTYYYDWLSLPNFNYDNPDVRDYMIEMSKWWIEEIGIDGFRCDVAWGVQSRYADFWPEWRHALKTIRPEVFLLGEAGIGDFTYITDRFDSAYDWALHHDQRNSFTSLFSVSSPAGINGKINNSGYPFPDYTYPFRFMENHDESRYISNHTPNQTTLAATLLLTIPGIPLIYAGQEVGEQSARGTINWDGDPQGLVYFYQRLIQARNMFPSIKSREQVYLANDQYSEVYSYGRYKVGEAPVVVGLNFSREEQDVTIQVPTTNWQIDPDETYYLNEIITNTHVEVTGNQLETINEVMPPYGKYVWVIADSVVTMSASERTVLPQDYSLDQNYPNPFNPETVIGFNLPEASTVKLTVYNLLGQKVVTLLNRPMTAGHHNVLWNGRNMVGNAVASGVYFYRMEAGEFVQNKKMLLLK